MLFGEIMVRKDHLSDGSSSDGSSMGRRLMDRRRAPVVTVFEKFDTAPAGQNFYFTVD